MIAAGTLNFPALPDVRPAPRSPSILAGWRETAARRAGPITDQPGAAVIFQYESQKRTIALITGKHHAAGDGGQFVSNTGGDFDPAPELDEYADEDEEADSFGFRYQRAAA